MNGTLWSYRSYSVESNILLPKFFEVGKIEYHSSEIRGLCLMKWPGETLQNLSYFWNTKTNAVFSLVFPLMNTLYDISRTGSFGN